MSIEFFKPLWQSLDLFRSRRNCHALPDELWLEAGVRRCLSLFQSGRGFLQDLADRHDTEIFRSTFFESLKSKRRLALLTEILNQIQARMRRTLRDPFATSSCLEHFDLYAGDGHFIITEGLSLCHDRRPVPLSCLPFRSAKGAAYTSPGQRPELRFRNHVSPEGAAQQRMTEGHDRGTGPLSWALCHGPSVMSLCHHVQELTPDRMNALLLE